MNGNVALISFYSDFVHGYSIVSHSSKTVKDIFFGNEAASNAASHLY